MCASYVGSTVRVCNMASGEGRWGAGGRGVLNGVPRVVYLFYSYCLC